MQTVRHRVVTRARFLQGDQAFLAAMRDSVSNWNNDYPEFQTRQVSLSPGAPLDEEGGVRPLPNERVFQLPPDLARAHDEPECSARADEAVVGWQNRIEALADLWWKPAYFPRWTGPMLHPAAAFVRACHMCDPPLLDAEAWILPAPLTPFLLSFNPMDAGGSNPAQQRRLDRYYGFYGLLVDAVRSGAAITEDLISALDAKADHEATSKELERPRKEFAYLPIFPGVERRDYRAAESTVMSLADDNLRQFARELHQQGFSHRRIAGDLGVNRSTVKRWLSR
jgi:hypothetical protein